MTIAQAQPELAEPHLRQVLTSAGLDVEYVRAEGNVLYRLGPDGQEIPVLDFAGGYGSLMFGHNHPELVATAVDSLRRRMPVLAQFSLHPNANRLAAELNRIIHRELGSAEPYYAIFANSGAEAIEAAVKHAELDRGARAGELLGRIDAGIESARVAVRSGEATVSDELCVRFGVDRAAPATDRLEQLADRLRASNAGVAARVPVLLALEKGFHGKLIGSLQLTHNESYRLPFMSLAVQARFVPPGRPDVLSAVVDDARASVFDVAVEDGGVTVVDRDFPVFCAFLLEPIQGEGGINVLSREFAENVQRICAEIDCPIVVDEIQSGLGRTGALLASSHLGLRGDYYAMAKSFGGGIAKAAVMLVREGRYRADFEMVHSSTFAKDGFSCALALKTLELLEADGGRAYRQAVERGAALTAMFGLVRADFPDVLVGVRGKGLMLGVELADQSAASSEIIRELARAGVLGYVLCGYLLREHRIRTFPTASAVNTLRFEPSVLITDNDIAALEKALRDLCRLVRDQDGTRLVPPPTG